MSWLGIELTADEQRIVLDERESHPCACVRRRMWALWLRHCSCCTVVRNTSRPRKFSEWRAGPCNARSVPLGALDWQLCGSPGVSLRRPANWALTPRRCANSDARSRHRD